MDGNGTVLARRYERLLWSLVLASNYFGATILILYAFFAVQIYPNPGRSAGGMITGLLKIGLPYLVIAAFGGISQARRKIRPALAWLNEEREPNADERRAVGALPVHLATVGTTYWMIGGLILFPYLLLVMDFDLPTGGLVRSLIAFVLYAITPWSLSHLLVDRALRPVYAAAFTESAAMPRALGIPTRLLLAWVVTSGLPILAAFVTFFLQDTVHRSRAVPTLFMSCAAGIVGGVVVAAFSGRAITEPLAKLRAALRDVEQGHLDADIAVTDSAELGELQVGFNRMVAGLREREWMRDVFGRHVGTEVARRALVGDFALGGERRSASAMFVDIIGSTNIAQTRSPEDVVSILNAFFEAVVRVVTAEGGLVNKFQGDGALCIFGAPADQLDHAARALRAARSLHAELLSLPADGVEAAIGISSGEVVAGNVGSADRYEYTVVGDPVNEAARLTEQAKTTPSHVLVSESTIRYAGAEDSSWVPAGPMALRGRAEPTLAYELAG
jgi:adenylate cyclase